MELRQLKYIIQIAESGSLSKAAAEIFIAQSSLSSFLKKYEKDLGYTLFIRTSKGLFPTTEGKIFLVYAKEMIEQKRKLLNQLSDISNLKMGNIRFSISPYRTPYLLPSLLVAWKDLYPNISIEIIEANIPEQEELLRNNAVDLGFLINNNNDDNGLVYRNIMEEELFIGAHPSFKLKKKAYKKQNSNQWWIDINDIKGEPFLLYSVNHHLNKFAASIFDKYNFRPEVIQTQDNFETILRLAEKAMGITFVPHTYTSFHKNLEYYSIGNKSRYRTLALGYPSSGYLSNATIEFSNLIVEMLCNDSYVWEQNKYVRK
jgi:LysR family hydrogen peroxide-inducible transcriptional activator